MKTIKAQCKICGEIEVPPDFWEYDGSGFSVATEVYPTLEDVEKWYWEFEGKSYEEVTGNKLEESVEKTFGEFSHESPDDIGWEEAKKHLLEPIEVWQEKC